MSKCKAFDFDSTFPGDEIQSSSSFRMFETVGSTGTTSTSNAFQTALEKFKRRLSKEELKSVEQTSYEDVVRELGRIQMEQEQLKSMLNLARIETFLEAGYQYGKILEVFLNASPVVCFVWGPLKLLLQTASTFTESFEAFLDAYEQIGESFPLVEILSKLLRPSPPVLKAYEMIFIDLLDFHKNAIRFCSGPLWQRLFRSAWKNFGTQFQGIIKRLRRHRDLVESQANLLHLQQSQDHFEQCQEYFQQSQEHFRKYEQDLIDIQKKLDVQLDEEQAKKRIAVIEWLSGANSSIEHDSFCATRGEYPDTGNWILRHDGIRNWKDEDEPETPIVWTNGIPGAGKTILASIIIEDCKLISGFSTSYFYCKDNDPERNSTLAVLKGLLTQMLDHYPELLPHCYDTRLSSPEVFLRSPGIAKQLLEVFCAKYPEQYIIIDGLDECDRPERKEILRCFIGLVASCELEHPGKLRVLFVSQEYPDVRKILMESKIRPKIIPLSVMDNGNDIDIYCNHWMGKIQRKNELTQVQREYIHCLTVGKARGMFLYAKLVMDNLFEQPTRQQLLEEIDERKFPNGLEEAYHRIIDRIKRNTKQAEWESAKKLLGWMVCQKRPMGWVEMQVVTSMNVEAQDIEFDDRRLRVHIHDICGSLVKILPGDRVELVHSTAKQYIANTGDVHAPSVECELAGICMSYLTFDCFEDDNKKISRTDLQNLAARGHLAFQDYAAAKWFHHVNSFITTGKELLSDANAQERLETFAMALDDFLVRYQDEEWYDHIIDSSKNACEAYQDQPFYDNLLAVSSHIYRHQEKGFEARNEVSIKSLEKALNRNRKFLEHPPSGLSELEKEKLYQFHGNRRFKCRKITCLYFYEGFKDAKSRDKHVNRHDRPFHCTDPHCLYADSGFGSNIELEAHMRSYHPELSDLATSFKSTTRKTITSNWNCHICQKNFTRGFHLKNHINSHNGTRPYACAECGKAFTRLNDCKRHQKLHDRR
ncbi:hypothetical protein K469DRAFT_691815 [Zopfia rhizophila CBS 207.26]|uniref:C2H2-type domain-containing protein n=1 Tax=Zopfia rhizophila CBS 207.26 TaxID=1314779 RepID=A0A6A6DU92_9PEZI|nr:hypothetical protein K469DRAFT_691815 [Zopfia rhizophila CBS 207.26]